MPGICPHCGRPTTGDCPCGGGDDGYDGWSCACGQRNDWWKTNCACGLTEDAA